MNDESALEKALVINIARRQNPSRVQTPEELAIVDHAQGVIAHRSRIVESMEPFMGPYVEKYVNTPQTQRNWQPADFLPDFSQNWEKELVELQDQCMGLNPALLVVLVGDMITEEALPSYESSLVKNPGIMDESGSDDTNWAKWIRWWTAEENRHGDVLNKYLTYSGRINMRKVEDSIQYLIGEGFNPETGLDPYKGFFYTTFQEKATFVSHMNTARIAKEQGNKRLYTICAKIAGDENRHHKVYDAAGREVMNRDVDGAMTSLQTMLRSQIAMPAKRMYDGETPDLFEHFSHIATELGVYTTADYLDIMRGMIQSYDIANRQPTTDEAKRAQEGIIGLPKRYERLAAIAERKQAKKAHTVEYIPPESFTWITN